ncbi:glycosyltransferase [Adhaeribacter rhizoryzae]|uniref:Glycosyltransferase family 4 protein n=1 Tax=Adhaeribacter rhizoryzae TaxID=2607907 RepID=A0A5M6DB26_9BACT|nr:glycosyltransferase [Adhaeribacter rhizoryzae]KAA5544747.1 glycosyltransferase family 4 protein [Adhaeribacter rhizoryzae]
MYRKKILLITVRADFGGGPKHVDLLINNISNNFELYVACPPDKPYFELWQNNPKVKSVFQLPHRKFNTSKLTSLAAYCRQNQIGVVHSHGKGAGVYARLLKIMLPSLKVIHTLHGFHIGEYGQLQKQLYFLYEKALAPLTKTFINVSEGEKKQCIDFKLFKPNHSVVIYNAIAPLENKAIPILPKLANKTVITTISRFDFQKNMELAYEIAKVFKNQPDVAFLWIGDGSDKPKLAALAQREKLQNIYFTGFCDNIAGYLSLTDIYLSTSRWEGLPYALIEAASVGIPIVASDVVGNNEIVEPNNNGFLFNLNSPEEAVAYLKLLVADKDTYAAMSEAAYRIFQKKFRIEAMIAKLESVYEN